MKDIFVSKSYLVRGTEQNFRLHLGGEAYEIIAIATDSDDKVRVCFGTPLRLKESLAVDDIDLKLEAATLKIGFDKRHYIFQ